MPPRRPFVVVDLEDDGRHQALLHEFADPERGIIHVEARSNNRSLLAVNRAVARAYGKRTDRPGWIDEHSRFDRQLRAWMSGEDCRLLVVSRAHHLDGHGWWHIADLADLAGVQPWLLVQGIRPTRGQREIAHKLNAKETSFAALERQLHRFGKPPAAGPSAERADESFPDVPESDFYRFLHDCRCLLDDTSFQQVYAVFADGRQAAWAYQDSQTADEAALASLLRDRLPLQGSGEQALSWLRGFQVGLLGGDLQLWLSLPRLLDQVALRQVRGLTPQIAQELRTFFGSPHTAAALISILTGKKPELIANLNLADIAPDGSRITTSERSYKVPAYARGILRTQVAFRRSERASGRDPLIASRPRNRRERGHRLRPDNVWTLLKKVTEATHLDVIPDWAPREEEPPLSWIARHGIKIRRIHRASEAAT